MNARQVRRPLAIARGRERILQQWREAIETRGTATKNHATDLFLAKLARSGKAICRATLYLWETRYVAGGLEGLVDGRSDPGVGGAAARDLKLIELNLPGGVRLNLRLDAGAVVEVRQCRKGLTVDIRTGAQSAGKGGTPKAV
jgi:hypothetical protein